MRTTDEGAMISDPCPGQCGRMLHSGPCIFGAMKGVFSGPEADAYFGERTGGADATDAEIRECFHKAHAEAWVSGKGSIAAEEAGWRAVYELGTGPAPFSPGTNHPPAAQKPLVSKGPPPGTKAPSCGDCCHAAAYHDDAGRCCDAEACRCRGYQPMDGP